MSTKGPTSSTNSITNPVSAESVQMRISRKSHQAARDISKGGELFPKYTKKARKN